jgi:LemA protein
MNDPVSIPIGPILIIAVPVIIFLWLVLTSNRLTQLRNLVRESWSDIEVQLKRRHDLIPNLVETVKGYAAHEQAVLDRVMQARAHAMSDGGNMASRIAEEGALVGALNGLFARVEAYPQLKASEHFLALQQELTNTEDRIAAARRFFNSNVRSYNTMCDSFPSGLIASLRTMKRIPYFEVDTVQALNSIPVNFQPLPDGSRILPGSR